MSQVGVSEQLVDVAWRGETLAGSLHLPADSTGAIVLMVQGSGPSDRNAEGYFTAIRGTFHERGIATFAFDKPGCGASTGDWRRHALFDRADQATVVLNALANHAEVDDTQLGIWGQSQGGWLVQIVAAQRSGLAFAISNSGPSIGVAAQNLYGCEHSMRSNGHDDTDVAMALAHIEAIHAAAARDATYAEVDTLVLAPARGCSWASYLDGADADEWASIVALVREAYEPLPTLERVRCPYLAIFGGLDVLVPAWSGARETGQALRSCSDATVVVFPHGDHRIQIGGPLDFAPGYLQLLGDWAEARLRRAG